MKTFSKTKITVVLVCLTALILPLSWYCRAEKQPAKEEFIAQEQKVQADKMVGKLWGTITNDKTGEPVSGVKVMLVGTSIAAATDVKGNYFLIQVPPGKYEIQVQT